MSTTPEGSYARHFTPHLSFSLLVLTDSRRAWSLLPTATIYHNTPDGFRGSLFEPLFYRDFLHLHQRGISVSFNLVFLPGLYTHQAGSVSILFVPFALGNSRYPRDTDRRFQCCGAHFRKICGIESNSLCLDNQVLRLASCHWEKG
jgi:hypothetical protein